MIVDAHCHLGLLPRFRFEARSLGEILAACDQFGIEQMNASHHRDLLFGSPAGDEEMRRAYEESGGRVLAYCVFDPRRPHMARECERLLQRLPYVGIKIHPTFHATPAEDPAYVDAFALAEDADVPLLAHTWFRSAHNPPQALSFPECFRVHLERFHEAPFILGHAGGGKDGLQAALALLKAFPNVYADLAGDVYEAGLVDALVRAAGAERVLFASDLPWLDPRAQLGCVLASGIAEDALALVLAGNARRLFRLPGTGV